MSKYNITMKQKNDSDYNELYPESLDTQIKLSKDTTGFTGTNVSEVLMELNSKIPSGMAGSSYKIIGYLENYRNNESMTANVVNKVEIPWTSAPTDDADLYILWVGNSNTPFKKTKGDFETGVFFIGPDIDKIYSTLNNKKYGIGFGYDFNNFKINENYAGATFSTLDYIAWGVIEEFYGVDYSPSQITQIDGLISYHNSSGNILSKDYSCQFSTNATSGYLRTRWMITNINNNNITCHFGLQSGSADNYSLWSLNVVALKRSN